MDECLHDRATVAVVAGIVHASGPFADCELWKCLVDSGACISDCTITPCLLWRDGCPLSSGVDHLGFGVEGELSSWNPIDLVFENALERYDAVWLQQTVMLIESLLVDRFYRLRYAFLAFSNRMVYR